MEGGIIMVARKKSDAQKAKAGDKLVCEVCGISMVVDECCGLTEYHEIVCCGKPLKVKKSAAKKKTSSKKSTAKKKK
jgi:hypothetical protein